MFHCDRNNLSRFVWLRRGKHRDVDVLAIFCAATDVDDCLLCRQIEHSRVPEVVLFLLEGDELGLFLIHFQFVVECIPLKAVLIIPSFSRRSQVVCKLFWISNLCERHLRSHLAEMVGHHEDFSILDFSEFLEELVGLIDVALIEIVESEPTRFVVQIELLEFCIRVNV